MTIEIFGDLEECIKITDEPKLPTYTCFPSAYIKKKYDSHGVYGNAIDFEDEIAVLKSKAEMVERLSLENCIPDKRITNLQGCKIEPFVRRNDFSGDIDQISWVSGTDIQSGSDYPVPSQWVYNDNTLNSESAIISERISTGAAANTLANKGDVIECGTMECIERHSTMHAYYGDNTFNKVYNVPENVQTLLNYLERYRLSCDVYAIQAENAPIHTFFACTQDFTGIGQPISFGASSGFNYEYAILKALLESIQFRFACRLLLERRKPDQIAPDEVISIDHRMMFWLDQDRRSIIDGWLSGNRVIEATFDSIVQSQTIQDMDQVKEFFAKRNITAISTDFALPEIVEAGWLVSKVIIPQYTPLFLDERAKSEALTGFNESSLKKPPHPFL